MTPSVLTQKETFRERHAVTPKPGTMETGQSIISEIKGLEILKEGTYAVDLENTISDMLDVIKRMEAQLESVLDLNARLENDLCASKDLVVDLNTEKSRLEENITRMEKEMPSSRELQLEIDELIGERNDVQVNIRSMKTKIEKLQKENARKQNEIRGLKEDKQDIILEIDYVEAKLGASLNKMGQYRDETDLLRGERLTLTERITALESELKEANKEKFQLFQELKNA